MKYLRFRLDLAIPEDDAGTLILSTTDPETQAKVGGIKVASGLVTKLSTIRQNIRDLKAYATKINAGADNEELTVSAKFHICHNADNQPCEAETDI